MQEYPHQEQPFTAEDVEGFLRGEIDESSELGRRMLADFTNDPSNGSVARMLQEFNTQAVKTAEEKLNRIFENTMKKPIQRNVQQLRNNMQRRLQTSREDEPKTGEPT